jgi:hypothetical protein
MRWSLRVLALALPTLGVAPRLAAAPVDDEWAPLWRARFEREVGRRLDVPEDERQRYLGLLKQALAASGHGGEVPQALLLVDRSVHVQAIFVLLKLPNHEWSWLGASPVSTGRVGAFDHFRTPVGVFVHGPQHPDFRAEGTLSSQHVRGYGLRGNRVFDFGWVDAERGWGAGGKSPMRLQMHATDPGAGSSLTGPGRHAAHSGLQLQPAGLPGSGAVGKRQTAGP